MKTVDLTIFSDIKESDFYRIAEKEWVNNGIVKLKAKVRKDQEDMLFKSIYPNWFDGRTRDGKTYKKRLKIRKIPTIKIYETDFGSVELEIV